MSTTVGTQDPVIVEDASFDVDRFLRFPGEIAVQVGDRVEPAKAVGNASAGAGRTITVHLARELGVAADTVKRYLTKPIGSHFEAGESVARARKGLRTVTSEAPESGRLSDVNEVAGTAMIVPDAGTQSLDALVYGEVSRVVDGRGIVIRAGGARVRGAIALGADNSGPIKAAVDRHDRELTADGVTPDLRGAMVLGGMTVGAAAIRRLAEVGARGVIVGSITESDVRRVAAGTGTERPAQSFWQSLATNGPLAPDLDGTGFTIFVTEGFGRKPMAQPVFTFINEREGQTASVLTPGRERAFPTYPYLCFTSVGATFSTPADEIKPEDGVLARLIDAQHLGTFVTCRGVPIVQPQADGPAHVVVEVEFTNRSRRFVQLCNLELIKKA